MTTYRRATSSDWTDIMRIMNELDLVNERLRPEHFWVAEERGEIIGAAHVEPVGRVHYVSSVGVIPSHMKRGVATGIMRTALKGLDADAYLYTVIPEFFSKLAFEKAAVHEDIPGREIYDCGSGCDISKCECMVYRAR